MSIEFFIFAVFGLVIGTYFLISAIKTNDKLDGILSFLIVLYFSIGVVLSYIAVMDDKYYLLSYISEHHYENKYIKKRFKKEIYQLELKKCKSILKKQLNIKD